MPADLTTSLDGTPHKAAGSLAITTATEKQWDFSLAEGSPKVQTVQIYSDVDWYLSHVATGTGADATRTIKQAGYSNIKVVKYGTSVVQSVYCKAVSANGTLYAELLPNGPRA